MVKKMFVLLFSTLLVFALAMPTLAQQADQGKGDKEKAKKPDRWEGMVTVVSKDKSTLTVRQIGRSMTKSVQWDNTTLFSSQEHGGKNAKAIDASQIQEGDRVICIGTYTKDGILHASMISKRVTPMPATP